MIAFSPSGPILSFTGATSAPTSVHAVSLTGVNVQQYMLSNTDSTIDCVVGWGATDSEAKLNADAGSNVSKCYYLMRGTQVAITASTGAFFSGITGSSTAVIKVQAGYGN